MAETFKCPHCGAVYEIRYDEDVLSDEHATDCQVCGKKMGSTNGSNNVGYELIQMPDGTNV